MEVKRLACNNCGDEIKAETGQAGWLVLKVDTFYKLHKPYSKGLLQDERLDFCCEQCFLNYFITLINLKEKKDE